MHTVCTRAERLSYQAFVVYRRRTSKMGELWESVDKWKQPFVESVGVGFPIVTIEKPDAYTTVPMTSDPCFLGIMHERGHSGGILKEFITLERCKICLFSYSTRTVFLDFLLCARLRHPMRT